MPPLNLDFFHDMIPLEMFILNADFTIAYANATMTRSTGIHDFYERDMGTLISKVHLETLHGLLEKARTEKTEIHYNAEGLVAGEDREIIIKHHPTSDTFYILLLQRNTCTPLQHNMDALTGLPTREAFMEDGEKLLSQSQRFSSKTAILFMDLNGFKPVNDTYGHKAGDVVLKVISERMQNIIRKIDVLARFGGDEFVLGLANLKAGIHASLSVRRIIKAITKPIDIGELEVSVSGSFGIAIYPDDGEDLKTLIRYADEAMYKAKTTKLGYAFFSAPE